MNGLETGKERSRRLVCFGMVVVGMVVGVFFMASQVWKIPEPPEGMGGAMALQELVDPEARAVWYGREYGELVGLFEGVGERVPWGFGELGDRESWRLAGVKWEGPGMAYLRGEELVMVGWVDPEVRAQVEEAAIGGEEGWRRRELDLGLLRAGWEEVDEAGRVRRWMSTDGHRIAAGVWVGEGSVSEGGTEIWERTRFRDSPEGFGAFVRGEEAPILGVLDVGSLIERLPGQGHAVMVRNRLAAQLGDVMVAVENSEDRGTLRFRVKMGGDGEALFMDLGKAQVELPDIGGLARPGVLGVVRVSADPKAVLELVRTVIPVEEREALNRTLRALNEELLVDVEHRILENLGGQFAMVFYGIEDSFFEREGLELVASLTRLESTREALLVPIQDRREMEEYLNVFTQLSRGSLQRQVIRHTVQYAWFDDGALEWAVILNDDYLLFVDSAVAFDHASSWERSPAVFSGTLRDRGVEELMAGVEGMGVYLDLGTLRGIIDEGGMRMAAQWLSGVEAVSVRAGGGSEEGESETEVTIWLRGEEGRDE